MVLTRRGTTWKDAWKQSNFANLTSRRSLSATRRGPGVLPMTQVDRRLIADGRPGPITQQLIAALSEKVGVDIPGQAQRFARA